MNKKEYKRRIPKELDGRANNGRPKVDNRDELVEGVTVYFQKIIINQLGGKKEFRKFIKELVYSNI